MATSAEKRAAARLKLLREDAAKEVERKTSRGELGRVTAPEKIAAVQNSGRGAESIAAAEDFYERSKVADPAMQDALSRMKTGLGGLSTAENQALIAKGRRAISSDTQNSLGALKRNMGASGMIGGNYANQVMRAKRDESSRRASQMSDVIGYNMADQTNRLTEYGKATQNVYQLGQGAQQSALTSLTNVQGAEADRENSISKTNADITQSNITNLSNAEKENIGLTEKEIAREDAIDYGTQGIQNSIITQEELKDENKALRRAAKRGVR